MKKKFKFKFSRERLRNIFMAPHASDSPFDSESNDIWHVRIAQYRHIRQKVSQYEGFHIKAKSVSV
jgi:hypothetical protein